MPERGYKPGFYVIVSRDFVAQNEDVATVICAPIYGEILGLRSEMVVGPANGLPRESAIRCDFLTLMFKSRLKHFVGSLTPAQIGELSSALRYALDL
jgi:mRNA interferase MazF